MRKHRKNENIQRTYKETLAILVLACVIKMRNYLTRKKDLVASFENGFPDKYWITERLFGLLSKSCF